jgi:glycosyltransferase involved in cell wall biosynthesis
MDNGVDNIEFVGPKWGDALTPFLQGCKLVVVPSMWFEPSPYVIYQALGSGKPVVASRIGGIPDLITEDTGRLVDAGSVDGLAEAIAALCADQERLRQMGLAARNWAEEKLSPALYYEQIMKVYEDIGAVR